MNTNSGQMNLLFSDNIYYSRLFYLDNLQFISFLKNIPYRELTKMITEEPKWIVLLDKKNTNVQKNLQIFKDHVKSRKKDLWE